MKQKPDKIILTIVIGIIIGIINGIMANVNKSSDMVILLPFLGAVVCSIATEDIPHTFDDFIIYLLRIAFYYIYIFAISIIPMIVIGLIIHFIS